MYQSVSRTASEPVSQSVSQQVSQSVSHNRAHAPFARAETVSWHTMPHHLCFEGASRGNHFVAVAAAEAAAEVEAALATKCAR